ncbi:MAG: hypothetical protein KC425_09720 [Anaerolineales bacterium]|nr:hypothetical protein [Anaerolineales bacterium]
MSQRIESLATDFFTQLRQAQSELTARLDALAAAQAEQLQTLQAETRQRDDAIRQELLQLTARLSDHKVSRQEMGQMLVELGQRLTIEPR